MVSPVTRERGQVSLVLVIGLVVLATAYMGMDIWKD